MIRYTNIQACRLCDGDLKEVINFGQMPLANDYAKSATDPTDLYPLTLVRCQLCGHYQIKETVDPEILFSNFLYASGDSPTLVGHFNRYADEVLLLQGRKGFSVLDIASNDGLLTGFFKKLGAGKVVGVEPALNLVEFARTANSAAYIHSFFGSEVGCSLSKDTGTFDVVTANNVMAHVANLNGVMEGVVACMADDGIFIFENAYLLDTVRNHCYDNTYHEHLQYYGIRPLVGFLKKHGLELFDVSHQPTQSGSFRCFAKRISNSKWRVSPSVDLFLKTEEEEELYTPATATGYRDDFYRLYDQLFKIVDQARKEGSSLSCYGASAKLAMLSKTLGLDFQNTRYVVDDAKAKQGLLSPGGKIPIVDRESFHRDPTDYSIISAWNLASPIMEANKKYPGRFILPVPEPRVVTSTRAADCL
ncbi:MAG: class I SAM-dependent methyltransferase [Patescibacteria group bacterium]